MSFIKDENGQGMLEYVLIIALVAVVAVVALFAVNKVLKNEHQQDNNYIAVYVVFYVSIGTKLIQGVGKPAPCISFKNNTFVFEG